MCPIGSLCERIFIAMHDLCILDTDVNIEQILYNICSGELLKYTVWFLLELILYGTNIQSQ
jgi:hypothetical protein